MLLATLSGSGTPKIKKFVKLCEKVASSKVKASAGTTAVLTYSSQPLDAAKDDVALHMVGPRSVAWMVTFPIFWVSITA